MQGVQICISTFKCRVSRYVSLGSAAWGAYTIGLIGLGQRFRGGELAAANAAFVLSYTFGSITGPPISGIAIDVWNPNGLIGLMLAIAIAIALTCLAVGRQMTADVSRTGESS